MTILEFLENTDISFPYPFFLTCKHVAYDEDARPVVVSKQQNTNGHLLPYLIKHLKLNQELQKQFEW